MPRWHGTCSYQGVRWLLSVFLTLVSGTAWAAAPVVRTSATPGVQGRVALHPKVALAARLQGRFKLAGPQLGDRAGLAFATGLFYAPHPIVGLSVNYVLGHGDFPLEGVGRAEHTAAAAIQLGGGERFVVSNTTRLEFRNQWVDGYGHRFSFRPRNALRLTAVVRPWFKTSLDTEALVSPEAGLGAALQMRGGLAVHGDIPLGHRDEPAARPPPNLFWLTGAGVALTPVALARGTSLTPLDRLEAQAVDRASTVDVVITAGVGASF